MKGSFLKTSQSEVFVASENLEVDDDENRCISMDIPSQILSRGPMAVEAFLKAASKGTKETSRLRIMLVGKNRVGKTSLKKVMLNQSFDSNEIKV